jgi:RNA polymerase sigma factor (sigma-70 family)
MIPSPENNWQNYLRTARGADFTAVVSRHGGWMLGVATRATGNHAVAEDIAQEALVLLLRKRPHCPTEAELGAWLHRTVVLLARNHMKKEQRRAAVSLPAPDQEPVPELPGEVLRALDAALDSLPQADRELILARHYRNRSWEQLASELGKTADTLRKQGSRVLAKLAVKLRKRGAVSVAALESYMGSGRAAELDAATAAQWSKVALGKAPAIAAGGAWLAVLKNMA